LCAKLIFSLDDQQSVDVPSPWATVKAPAMKDEKPNPNEGETHAPSNPKYPPE